MNEVVDTGFWSEYEDFDLRLWVWMGMAVRYHEAYNHNN